MHPGEHARRQHRRREPRALLVGPVRHHDRMPRPDPEVVHRPHHLERPEHAQHPVVLAPGRLGVEVAADIDRQRVRILARPGREHRPHRVDAERQPRRVAPAPEQRPPLGVGVGQRLAVVAPRDPRPDLRHLHDRVPEPGAVDPQVLARCSHLRFQRRSNVSRSRPRGASGQLCSTRRSLPISSSICASEMISGGDMRDDVPGRADQDPGVVGVEERLERPLGRRALRSARARPPRSAPRCGCR